MGTIVLDILHAEIKVAESLSDLIVVQGILGDELFLTRFFQVRADVLHQFH